MKNLLPSCVAVDSRRPSIDVGASARPFRFAGLLVLALVLGMAAPAAAKPLYLTVPRAYGTGEPAVVDVAFEGKAPVELRVLRPTSLDAFIQSQSDMRRAYKQVTTQHNPGRALSRGLNAVRGPGAFLLNALGDDFRLAVAPKLPDRPKPTNPTRPVTRLLEGAPKLVSVPDGMAVVRTEWLNLDLGGEDRDFHVPGFEHWSGNSGFEERRVSLNGLEAGVYVLQMVQDKVEGQVVLVVTDLTAQLKQTDGEILVRVAGRNQQPVAGAEVAVHLGKGKKLAATTDENGEARVKVSEPKLLVSVTRGSDTALVDTDFYSTLAVAPDLFLYSDRPIYKPGDQVRFRGIVRQPDGFLARLFAPKKREVEVQLVSQEGALKPVRVKLDEFGSFSGTLDAPAEAATGVMRLVASLDGQPHEAEARVQKYVKPTFFLELLGEQETVTPGGSVKARVRARRYAGGAAPEVAYEVFLYRTLLDSPAWVDDAGRGGEGSAVTYGSTSTTEGRLSVPERLYSSLAVRMEASRNGDDSAPGDAAAFNSEDPWASAPRLNADGEGDIEIPVPALEPGDDQLPWRYSLSVRAVDTQKSEASGARSFFLAPSEVMGVPRFASKLFKAGGEASLAVRATTLSGRPFPGAEGKAVFVLRDARGEERARQEQTIRADDEGIWRGRFAVPAPGTLTGEVILKDGQQRPWSGEANALVIGEDGDAVTRVATLTLESLDGALAPGDQAEVVALFPDAWGAELKNEGPVWITLSGAGLYETRLLQHKGLTLVHRFEIEPRFGSAVYATVSYPTASGRWEERTAPFRIVPRERALQVSVQPEKREVLPLGEQAITLRVSDHRGRPVRAQVSVGVVDKAIYALQSELRPDVLSFFYPLTRDNVATFTSSEFQGYGYGEPLARKLAKLPGYRFSAIKPPTRLKTQEDRDTAFWRSDIVTDADGRATVRFAMPSNQTLWTVTALAADASGRFGESTAEFASRGGLSLVASLPQFLREGDQAMGSVRVAQGELGKDQQAVEVAARLSGSLEGEAVLSKLLLSAQGEAVVPVAVRAGAGGTGRLEVTVGGLTERVADLRRLDVLPGSLEETVAVNAWGGGELTLPVTADSTLASVELTLQPSVVGAALTNLRSLLSYPYGCVEQLVATTVPNIAIYEVLQKVDALARLDPSSRSLLAEARSRSVQGVDRILALSVKGGGFTWFGGYSTPSGPMTLIALDGLSYAVEAGLVDRNDRRITESVAWMGAQELPLELDAVRTYVLTRLNGNREAARARALLDKAQATPESALTVALAVLAAEQAGIRSEPKVKAQVATLAASSGRTLFQPAVFQPDPQIFWHFPLRSVGMTALLAHAASFGEVDVAAARKRILEALSTDRLSTFDRSTALLHSLWLLERDAKEMRKLPPPKLEVAGGAVKLQPQGMGLAAKLDASARTVKLASFDGMATLKATVHTPLASVKPAASGMSLERRYFVLREEGRKELGAGDAVAQGEDVFVELELDARGTGPGRLRSAYYVLEDAVPAGFAPLIEDKIYRGPPHVLPLSHESLKRRALSPERATFFFEEPAPWSDSPRMVGYVLRAQFAGTFVAPPATVEDMYVPEIRARTAAASLVVKESGKREAR